MDDIPPMLATPPPVSTPPATSLPARLLNVFATPGEVFEEVKASPAKFSNWLVPCLLAAVIGVVTVLILFAQPDFLQQARDQWASAYDGMVKAGKLSQADADRAVAMIEKFAPPLGAISAVGASFVRLFWWALVLWLLGRFFLKANFGYLKSAEVAGLALMISVLGGIVTLLLSVNFGKLSGANLDLLLGSSDPKSKLHPLLAVLDVFNFWLLGVMASGLARLAGVNFGRALFLVLGYWLTLQMVLLSIALLTSSLMQAAK